MNLKRSPFAIQDKNVRDLDNAKDYPTIADLMREQKVPLDNGNIIFLYEIFSDIIFIFKLSCWSSIRICLCLKPYIFISRLMSMPS